MASNHTPRDAQPRLRGRLPLAFALVGGALCAQADEDFSTPELDQAGAPSATRGGPAVESQYRISNGVVTLGLNANKEFGLVYSDLLQDADLGIAAKPGVILKPTSLWKVALVDRDFDYENPPLPGADGVVFLSANEVVPRMPTVVSGADTLTSEWKVLNWKDTSGDPDAQLLPVERFTVRLTQTAVGPDVIVDMEVELEPESELSTYMMEARVAVPSVGTKASQILAVPWYMGALIPQPLSNPLVQFVDLVSETRLSDVDDGDKVPTHPGVMSMQWMAYYDEADPDGDLFFWGTRDEDANLVKPYLVYTETNSLAFGVQYYPPNNLASETTTAMPFDVVMTPLHGDWYDGAEHYRAWVEGLDAADSFAPAKPATDPAGGYSATVRDADAVGVVLPAPCDPSTPAQKDHDQFQHWGAEWAEFDAYFVSPTLGDLELLGRPWFWDWNAFATNFGEWFDPFGGLRPEFVSNAPAGVPQYSWAPYFHPSSLSASPGSGFFASYVEGHVGEPAGDLYVVRDEGLETPTLSALSPPQDTDCAPVSDMTWVCHDLCHGTGFPFDYTTHVLGEMTPSLDFQGLYLDEFHIGETVCYDPLHLHSLFQTGGGTYFVDGKRLMLELTKADMRASVDPEFFLWIEGPSEAYLSSGESALVEMCWSHYGGLGGLTGDEVSDLLRIAPLYQTVYNEYQRFADRLTINGPDWIYPLDDNAFMERARQAYGPSAYQGAEAPLGSMLSDQLLTDNIAKHELLELLAQLVDSELAIFTSPSIAPLLRFGRRLRDPLVETPEACFAGSPIDCPAPDRAPLVYASAFAGSSGQVGLMFINWTHHLDSSYSTDGGLPGTQAGVTVTLDVDGYGVDPTTHHLVQVVPPAAEPVALYPASGEWKADLPSVPETSAVYFELRPITP